MEKEMSVVGHLTELRKRLIYVLISFVLSLITGFALSQKILNFLKKQPTAKDVDWNVFGFTDGFVIYFKCALIVSILFTLPFVLYNVWAFVKPGLTEKESKGTIFYVPLSFFLFLIGVSFSYFIVFPLVMGFMSSVNQSIGATETYGLSQYFTFMFNLILPLSIVFEMPVIIMFLTRVGILNPYALKKMRKVAYFALIVLGTFITPPDLISDFLVIIPLITLFEISILCSKWSYNKMNKNL